MEPSFLILCPLSFPCLILLHLQTGKVIQTFQESNSSWFRIPEGFIHLTPPLCWNCFMKESEKAGIQIEEIWKLEKYDKDLTYFIPSSNSRLKAAKTPNYRTNYRTPNYIIIFLKKILKIILRKKFYTFTVLTGYNYNMKNKAAESTFHLFDLVIKNISDSVSAIHLMLIKGR